MKRNVALSKECKEHCHLIFFITRNDLKALACLRQKIIPGTANKLNINRRRPLGGAFRELLRSTFRPEHPINVKFVTGGKTNHGASEGAVDLGGPSK